MTFYRNYSRRSGTFMEKRVNLVAVLDFFKNSVIFPHIITVCHANKCNYGIPWGGSRGPLLAHRVYGQGFSCGFWIVKNSPQSLWYVLDKIWGLFEPLLGCCANQASAHLWPKGFGFLIMTTGPLVSEIRAGEDFRAFSGFMWLLVSNHDKRPTGFWDTFWTRFGAFSGPFCGPKLKTTKPVHIYGHRALMWNLNCENRPSSDQDTFRTRFGAF